MKQVISWVIISGLGLSIWALMTTLYVDSLKKRINDLEDQWERGW